MKHRIEFPARAAGARPYVAEVEASTFELAQRAALEHAAANGIVLAHLNIFNVRDLVGACLDGLRLEHCDLSFVSLVGASMKNAVLTDCHLNAVVSDGSTDMTGSTLERVDIERSNINGLNARYASWFGVRLYLTQAYAVDLIGANVDSLRITVDKTRDWRRDGWKLLDCYLRNVSQLDALIESSAHTENEKAAVRSLSTTGNREAAAKWLAELNALKG